MEDPNLTPVLVPAAALALASRAGFAHPEEAARIFDITPVTGETPSLRKVDSKAFADALRRLVDQALATKSCSQEDCDLLQDKIATDVYLLPAVPEILDFSYLDSIVVKEKLYGIEPPEEGLEFTITVKAINWDDDDENCENTRLAVRNLSTGNFFKIQRLGDIYALSVYRGYLLVHVLDKGLFLVKVNCELNEISFEEIISTSRDSETFLLDKSSNPPTLVGHKSTSHNSSMVTRYGNIELGDKGMELETLFSLPLPGKVFELFQVEVEIGVAGQAIDHQGRIWIHMDTNPGEILILSPDFEILQRVVQNQGVTSYIFPWKDGEVWIKSRVNRRAPYEFFKLSYKM